MQHRFVSRILSCGVISLTLIIVAGCSPLKYRSTDNCKTHAYLRTPLKAYLKSRFDRNAPVRMAIIPFDAPANLTALNKERPGIGNEVTWALQRILIGRHEVPIVEVFARDSWPRKKEDFFTGNFGALQRARRAGYDLVLVGAVQNLNSLSSLSASAKLIEVETGQTIWNADAEAYVSNTPIGEVRAQLGYERVDPSQIHTRGLSRQLAYCLQEDLLNEDPVPDGL